MRIELINIGSELLLGHVLNTHQQWIGRQLSDRGWTVDRQVAVGDTAGDIEAAVREALERADVVMTTGGLGPTSDDITRERIAALVRCELREDPAVVEHVAGFFAARRRPVPLRTRVEAQVPEGARVLMNAHGTAPGLVLELRPNRFRAGGEASWLILLPGPPRELRPMFSDQVLPLFERVIAPRGDFAFVTLKTTGLGESVVEERVAPPLEGLVKEGLEIGYCARTGEVDVRLAARGREAAALVGRAESVVQGAIGDSIFGRGDESLEGVIVRMLTERGRTLAVAESCTGGYVANRITNVPGASSVLLVGWVTYSNEAKQRLLGVEPAVLEAHGAVSEPVARQMAEGARRAAGADYALATTGIAGPGGGTAGKPVGTVYIALALEGHTFVLNPFNPFDRETFKYVTSQQALELLRRSLRRAEPSA